MSSLEKSDFYKYEGSEPKSPFYATNTSGFKSIGRETSATWAFRFTKDINDLSYALNFSQIKGKDDIIQTYNQFRLQKKLSSGGKTSKRNWKNKAKSALRIQMMSMNKLRNPQKIHVTQHAKYSTIDTQGLCKFEFQKTILGKLKNRQFHHLSFKNQTSRETMNKSQDDWNQVEECVKTKLYKTINVFNLNPGHYKINKCHDFKSYSPRRVFEPKDELDKMYEVGHLYKITKPTTIKEIAKISIVKRDSSKEKESSKLVYNEYESKKGIMKSPPCFEIPRSPRKTEIGREVISVSRGCYR